MLTLPKLPKKDIKKFIESNGNAHNWFVLIAVFFGFLFVFGTPLLWGQDEITHFDRAYQISRGHILPTTISTGTGNNYGGLVPNNAYKLESFVGGNLATGSQISGAHNGVKWVTDFKGYLKLGALSINGPKHLATFPNTAPYSPVAYFPSVLGLRMSEALNLNMAESIYTARLFALIFYIVCIYFLLKSLQKFKSRWLVFIVALLPSSLYQASTITADTMTLAVVLIVCGLFLKTLLKERLTRAETIVLLSSILLLPLIKPTYILFSFLILFIPNQLLDATDRLAKYIRYLTLSACLALFAYWSYLTRYLTNAPRLALPFPWANYINPRQQVHYTIDHPFAVARVFLRTFLVQDGYYLTGAVGGFGYNNILAPGIAIISSLSAMFLGVVNMEKLKISKTKLFAIIAITIGSILILFETFYMTITPVGTTQGPIGMIVQGLLGRYFIFYIPLTLIALGCIFKPRLNQGTSTSRVVNIAIVSLVIFSLLTAAVKYFYFTWG